MFWSRRPVSPPLRPDEETTELVRPPPRPPTAAEWILRGMRQSIAASSVVPVLNYVAFGTLAREAGFGPAELLIVAAGVWWVSGQVVLANGFAHNTMLAPTALSVFLSAIPLLPMVMSVLPLLKKPGRDWLAYPLALTVATPTWAAAQQQLGILPAPARRLYYAGFVAAFMSLCVGAAFLSFTLAAGLPGWARALLVFVLPLHLLFNAMGSARDGGTWLAIAAGIVMAPLLQPWLGDFTLIGVGLGAGTGAFLAVRLWRRFFVRVIP